MALYSAASFFLTWLVEWQFFGSGSLVYLPETDYTQHDYISAGCTAPRVARIMVHWMFCAGCSALTVEVSAAGGGGL